MKIVRNGDHGHRDPFSSYHPHSMSSGGSLDSRLPAVQRAPGHVNPRRHVVPTLRSTRLSASSGTR
jgi:hypothetical protein